FSPSLKPPPCVFPSISFSVAIGYFYAKLKKLYKTLQKLGKSTRRISARIQRLTIGRARHRTKEVRRKLSIVKI
ncbi:MAG: hypothetical protein WCD53_25910, partial [Microcoleus sp.]